MVIVDVDHGGIRGDALRHLVGVAGGRDAGAGIQELAEAGLGGQVPGRPAEEGPVGAHTVTQPGRRGQHALGRLPVGGEVVRAAKPVVVDPGRVRHAGVQAGDVFSLGHGPHHIPRLSGPGRAPGQT
jgi:hypothetical protein